MICDVYDERLLFCGNFVLSVCIYHLERKKRIDYKMGNVLLYSI